MAYKISFIATKACSLRVHAPSKGLSHGINMAFAAAQSPHQYPPTPNMRVSSNARSMAFVCDEVISSEKSGRRYNIVKVLGSGAFGEVLLAEDRVNSQQYAVKQLYVRDQDESLPLAVAREVAALQQLQHPNIVSLLDVATQGPCSYLIQELCRTDLAALINAANHHLSCRIVRSIMQQLLHALAAVHAHGLIHRDVKPSNVLISADGAIKLADFGLARCCCCNIVASAAGISSQQNQHQQQLCIHQQQIQQLQHHDNQESLQQFAQGQLQLGNQQHSGHQHRHQHCEDWQNKDHEQQGDRQFDHQVQQPLHTQPLDQQPGQDDLLDFWQEKQHSRNQAVHEQPLPAGSYLTAAQGTRWYRAPELLYGSRQYNTAVDIWAAGMVFAEILGLSPFIPGQSDIDQLALMQQTLGSISVQHWPEAEQLPDWPKICFGANVAQPLHELLPDASTDAVDLLRHMVQYNPSQRITAAAALQHDFFAGSAIATQPELAAAMEELLAMEQPSLRSLFSKLGKEAGTL